MKSSNTASARAVLMTALAMGASFGEGLGILEPKKEKVLTGADKEAIKQAKLKRERKNAKRCKDFRSTNS